MVTTDIGIYYLDEEPIFMTIVGLTVSGRAKNEIESLDELITRLSGISKNE